MWGYASLDLKIVYVRQVYTYIEEVHIHAGKFSQYHDGRG
jgi:hypothetical protein